MNSQASVIRTPGAASSLVRAVQTHPLTAYFLAAFGITWALFVPILLSPRALDLVAIPDAFSLLCFILATFGGPLAAALSVAALTSGKVGVRLFLKRFLPWKVGARWYLLVILGYPAVFLLGWLVLYGAPAGPTLRHSGPLFLSAYLVNIPFGLILPALGEEPGWRGFALPRLEGRFAPLVATLLLGSLHALWHLPAYFVHGAITDHFSASVFFVNSDAIIVSSVLWTWGFNTTRGSILMAMLMHSGSNELSAFATEMDVTPDQWQVVKILGVAALLVIIATRGSLGYRRSADTVEPHAVALLPLPAGAMQAAHRDGGSRESAKV